VAFVSRCSLSQPKVNFMAYSPPTMLGTCKALNP